MDCQDKLVAQLMTEPHDKFQGPILKRHSDSRGSGCHYLMTKHTAEMDRTTSQLANISQKLANEFQLTTDKFHGGQLSLLLKLLIKREDTCCAY